MPGDGRIWALELERAELPVVRNHKGSDGEMLTLQVVCRGNLVCL